MSVKRRARGRVQFLRFLQQFESGVSAVAGSAERVTVRVFLLVYFLYHLLHR